MNCTQHLHINFIYLQINILHKNTFYQYSGANCSTCFFRLSTIPWFLFCLLMPRNPRHARAFDSATVGWFLVAVATLALTVLVWKLGW